MSDPFRQARALEGLVSHERASALSLTGERLESELAELANLQAERAAASSPALRRIERLIADAWAEASRQLWNLMVQREALGLTRHDDLYDAYRVPKELRPSPTGSQCRPTAR